MPVKTHPNASGGWRRWIDASSVSKPCEQAGYDRSSACKAQHTQGLTQGLLDCDMTADHSPDANVSQAR